MTVGIAVSCGQEAIALTDSQTSSIRAGTVVLLIRRAGLMVKTRELFLAQGLLT